MAGYVPTQLRVEEALCSALAPEEHGARQIRNRDATLVEAITYRLERDFDTHLSLRELAASEQVSIFHMCRVFKRVVGTTIHQYHDEVRLRHALSQLLETELPLAQIALGLGFANQGHFSNTFRRHFLTTPGSVRRSGGKCLRF